jgi:hypothetical protein
MNRVSFSKGAKDTKAAKGGSLVSITTLTLAVAVAAVSS